MKTDKEKDECPLGVDETHSGVYFFRGDRKIHAKDATWDDFCASETYVPPGFDYSLLSDDFNNQQAGSYKWLVAFADRYSGA